MLYKQRNKPYCLSIEKAESLRSRYDEARKSVDPTVKKSTMHSWENLGINWIPSAVKAIKCSDKPSSVDAATDLLLLDPSKTKMVSYSAIRTSLSDADSISKIF